MQSYQQSHLCQNSQDWQFYSAEHIPEVCAWSQHDHGSPCQAQLDLRTTDRTVQSKQSDCQGKEASQTNYNAFNLIQI